MMPVYSYTDSHSQISSAQKYQPYFDAIPPPMMVDPSKSVPINQPWPYANNFGYAAPFHPCCLHGNSPGFYNYASCPYPPQFHCCAHQHQPPFPNACPVHYTPPPHLMKELSRYDYDKPKVDDFHCCGCPNHSHNQANGRSVKLEELPDVEKKMNDSSVPDGMKNFPYPVFWIPNEYLKNNEHAKPMESETACGNQVPKDVKLRNTRPHEQEPRGWNGWFPLDMKSLQSLMQGGDGERVYAQQNEDKMQQSPFSRSLQPLLQADDRRKMPDEQIEEKTRKHPFPIIWVPPYSEQDGHKKEKHGKLNADVESVKEPVKLPNTADSMSKPEVVHENSTGQVDSQQEKSSIRKTIPVKQIESPEKDKSERLEKREKVASLRTAEDNDTVKASRTSSKRGPSSPSKTSKLPPVCLRVDPLPKKRNANTNSRSPSPPGSKGKSQDTSKVSVSPNLKAKNHQDSQVDENAFSGFKEGEARKENIGKVVEIVGTKTCENKDDGQRSASNNEKPMSGSQNSQSDDSGEKFLGGQANKETRIMGNESLNEKEKRSANVDDLSDMQASEGKEATRGGESEAKKKVFSDDEAALRIQSACLGFEVRKWEPLKKLKRIAKVQEQVAEIRNSIQNLESSPDVEKDEKQRAIIEEMIMSILLKLDTIQGLHPSLRDVRKSLGRELVTLQETLDLLAQTRRSEDVSFNPVFTEERQSKDVGEQPHYDNEGQREQSVNVKMHLDENPEFDKLEELQREAADVKPAAPAEEEHSETKGSGQIEEEESKNKSTAVTEPTVAEHTSEAGTLKELPVGVTSEEATDEHEQIEQLKELPVGVLGDEATNQQEQMDLLKELPGGIIGNEENDAKKHHDEQGDEILDGADGVLKVSVDETEQQPADDGRFTITSSSEQQEVEELPRIDAPSSDEKISSQNETEKQFVESCNEISVDPDWLKVERENEFFQRSAPGRVAEQIRTIEVNNYNKQVDGDQPEATQQDSSILENGNEDRELKEVNQGTVLGDSSISKAPTTMLPSQFEKALNKYNEENVHQETGESSEEQSEEGPGHGEHDIPATTKHDEEALHISSADSRLPSELQKMEANRKLVEENEKMREMVEKLIEAGKEQLDAINNLTGRVKDLEKKLSRRKKTGAGRFRRATSCATSSSKSLKRISGNVVM